MSWRCFRQGVACQLLELVNSGAALAGVVHESILHSQLLTTDIKKLQQCRRIFGQICGKGKEQSKHCFRTKAELSTPNDIMFNPTY